MKVLVAEDDVVSRLLIQSLLTKWGYEVVATHDGEEAWQAFQGLSEPLIAILDWMMPGIDGIEVCRRIRGSGGHHPVHIIFLTAKTEEDDLLQGFEAGANDYLTKPFDSQELKARVRVAAEMVTLQAQLADRVRELEAAVGRIKNLEGILPICSYCKKVRDDQNYWQEVDEYLDEYSDTQLSHGICPGCYETIVKPELEQMKREVREAEGGN